MGPQVRQRAPLPLRYTIFPREGNILLRGNILRDGARAVHCVHDYNMRTFSILKQVL